MHKIKQMTFFQLPHFTPSIKMRKKGNTIKQCVLKRKDGEQTKIYFNKSFTQELEITRIPWLFCNS